MSIISMCAPYVQKLKQHQTRDSKISTMTKSEACEILGVDEFASEPEIRDAYNRLITRTHPDKGGSSYLAARVNQARDVLLKT